jgi:hypothetical protein
MSRTKFQLEILKYLEDDSLLGYSALMMVAVHSPDTSVNFKGTTRRYISEGRRRRDNPKSLKELLFHFETEP